MSEYQFVSQDTSEIIGEMISAYESQTGRTLRDADPDRLFLAWIASLIVQERTNQNYVGNQNIPSRARGENLDELGKWIFGLERREAQPAHTTMRFTVGTARSAPIIVPAGTRMTDDEKKIVWETVAEGTIAAGTLYVDISTVCQTAGTIGNGYAAGRINTLIDVDNVPYDVKVENTTESAGGSQTETDAEYYARLRASLDGYSSAGSRGAYIYLAKAVSSQIADVQVTRPRRTRIETLTVWTDGSDSCAFIGGDWLIPDTLTVTGGTIATDYTVDYAAGLLTITLTDGGALASAETLSVTIQEDCAGCVDIYALMDDGEIAGEEIKSAIEAACSDNTVRPLTDKVAVKDAEYYSYTVSLTYYPAKDDERSTSQIAADVSAAVTEYVKWQSAKIGRDINPSKLYALVMATGVKRVSIAYPAYHALSDGSDAAAPQVARLNGTPTITNGGAEDE